MKKLVIACVSTLAALTLLISTASAGSAVTIHFGYKSAALSPNSQTQLAELALDLKHLKNVLITAYVPDVGDVSENQLFADRRKETVKSYLEQQGVPVGVITTQAIPGPASKSRRVEISYGSAASAAPVTASTPPPPPMTAPEAAPPPPPPAPPSKPVITAQPEKRHDSGLMESEVAPTKDVDVSNEAYRGSPDQVPSRWEY